MVRDLESPNRAAGQRPALTVDSELRRRAAFRERNGIQQPLNQLNVSKPIESSEPDGSSDDIAWDRHAVPPLRSPFDRILELNDGEHRRDGNGGIAPIIIWPTGMVNSDSPSTSSKPSRPTDPGHRQNEAAELSGFDQREGRR
jgi:hypothetical protein